MAESYANLFGTNGAGTQNRIGSLFGQQSGQQQTPQVGQTQPGTQAQPQGQQRVAPQQTFAQMQQAGQARPAPPPVQPQAYTPYGGSQQAMQARTQMLGNLQQQLAQPTRFDTQAFQQMRQAQAANLQSEFAEQQRQLNEELARRGLSASTIGAAGMGRLAGAQSRALADIDAQLLQQAAQTQAQDRLAALQAGGQFAELAGAQDLAEFEARRVGQAQQFQEGLAAAQFGQGQFEFERQQALQAAQAAQQGQLSATELALRQQLGLGELTGQVGGTQTLAAQQQAEQRRQFDAEQQLRSQLGLGGLGIQQQEVNLRAQQLQQEAATQGRQLSIEEARLAAQREQFGAQLQEQQAGRLQQFGLSTRDLDLRAQQIQQQAALEGRSLDITQARNEAEVDLRAQQLAQEAGQFGQRLTLDQARLQAERDIEVARLEESRAGRLQQLGLSSQELNLRAQQLAQEAQLQGRTLDLTQARDLAEVNFRAEQLQQQAQLQGRSLGIEEARLLAQGQQFTAQQLQQQRQFDVELAQRQAEALTQQTGIVHTTGPDGQPIRQLINGEPVRTESSLARLDERRLREAELTGAYRNENGVSVNTLAAQRFGQEQMNDLMQRAAQQSQLTGVMHSVDANGNIVREVDANNQPISTEARRAQMVQEYNITRQQSMAQAEARSQQTGLSFIVDGQGNVVADIDPATGRQRTTAQAQQFNAQLAQQKELAAAELTGAININGVQVPTIAAQRLGQERLQASLQQAQQMSQMTGLVYRVNESGEVVPTDIRTESSLARLDARRMQEAELTGRYTDDNGVSIDTIAAKQFDQNRLNQLAEQALRQSQVTGVMYSVNAQGQIVQETGPNGQPISTESRRAQQVQELNVQRQLAQARADALSQQSGLSYTVNAAGDVVPDIDPTSQAQRTTVQAQQLRQQNAQFISQQAQQESQFGRTLAETALERELRQMLGQGQLTQQQRAFQLQLAAALSGLSEKDRTTFMAEMARINWQNNNSGGTQQERTPPPPPPPPPSDQPPPIETPPPGTVPGERVPPAADLQATPMTLDEQLRTLLLQ